MGVSSARRNKYDIHGYEPTSSEERIANTGDKDASWSYTKKLDSTDLCNEDLELGKGYMTTSVHGGEADRIGMVAENNRLGGWEDDRTDPNKRGQIVKTVHINQYASDP